MKAWYVAKTKPGKERLVEDYLTVKQDVEVFIPYIKRPSKKRSGLEMLFPSYIFCFTDPASKDWGAIRYAPGISYFLGYGTELVPVSEEMINHIKTRVSIWNNRESGIRYKAGDRLTVTNGPLSGLDVIFQRYIPSRQRCQVLVKVLGQLNKAEIPVEDIREKSQNLRLAYAN
jgi:transcription antitermination factor NusG